MRPAFIPAAVFRAYMKAGELNHYARVSGILVTSFISRCALEGRPIPFITHAGTKKYRLIQIIARARANCLVISPSMQAELTSNLKLLTDLKTQLEGEIKTLRRTAGDARHQLAMDNLSRGLTAKTLLTETEISATRLELPIKSGVYFLLQGMRIVYVGQSVNIFTRVSSHLTSKTFDGYAYVPCPACDLDVLESLYIHTLRPALNGRFTENGPSINTPLRLSELIAISGKRSAKPSRGSKHPVIAASPGAPTRAPRS